MSCSSTNMISVSGALMAPWPLCVKQPGPRQEGVRSKFQGPQPSATSLVAFPRPAKHGAFGHKEFMAVIAIVVTYDL